MRAKNAVRREKTVNVHGCARRHGGRGTREWIRAACRIDALEERRLLSLPAGVFEHDDNNAIDDAVAGVDWANVFAGTAGALATTFVSDAPVGDVSYFTGGGSKDVRDVSEWLHQPGDVAPDKNDITDAYAAAYSVDTDGNAATPKELIFYFGADKFDASGSNQIGFWFFKDSVGLNADGTFSGLHTVGDVLILTDFTQGGRIGTVKVLKWVGDRNGNSKSFTVPAAGKGDGPLQLLNATGNATAVVNDTTTEVAPWPYTDKDGNHSFAPDTFFEGGINVSALGLAGCFNSFLAESRSSGSSVDAQLKDFALGEFALCDADITIEPDAVNEVGTNHTFTVTVTKTDEANGFAMGPAAGVDVVVSIANTNGASASFNDLLDSDGDGNPANDTVVTTGADGTALVVINSATAGITTATASATVAVDGETIDVSTDGTSGNSDPAVKRWVDAYVTIGPDDTNAVGDPHTFVVTVYEDNGDGIDSDGDGSTFDPASGEPVSVSLTNSNGAGAIASTPLSGTTNANGQFSVTFTSNTAGIVTGHATANVAVGGLTLARQTNGAGNNGADAVKRFVDAYVTIAPDDVNGITEPHTFVVTVYEDNGDGIDADGDGSTFDPASGESVSVSLADSGGAASVPSTPLSGVTNANGQFSVTFTSASAGTVTGTATANVSVGGLTLVRQTNGTGNNSGGATKVFVAGALRWLKVDGGGAALAGAAFEVRRTHDRFGNDIVDDVFSVADNGPLDDDPDGGEFQLNDVLLGRYTIKETFAPTGYVIDPDTETVELTLANPSNADATFGDVVPVFVNRSIFRAQIVPTGTECTDFVGGTAVDLTTAIYSVKGGKISTASSPGAFFYYTRFTATTSSDVVFIDQTPSQAGYRLLPQDVTQVKLFTSACTNISSSNVTSIVISASGDVTLVGSGLTPGQEYVVSVKYLASSLVGAPAPSPTTLHFDFRTEVNGILVDGDEDGLDFLRR